MNVVTALAIAAGVLVAVLMKVAVLVNVPFWYVAVFGWASYIGAGGGMNGLKKAIAGGASEYVASFSACNPLRGTGRGYTA